METKELTEKELKDKVLSFENGMKCLTRAFARKHGLEYSKSNVCYCIKEGGVFFYKENIFLSIDEIYFDIKNKRPENEIIDWWNECFNIAEHGGTMVTYFEYSEGKRGTTKKGFVSRLKRFLSRND